MNQAWGVPDWRDDKAYRAYMGATTDDFRWQFLRRMPAYRADWLTFGVEDAPAAFAPDTEEKYGLEVLINPAQPNTPAFVWPDLVVPPWTSKDVLTGEAALFVERAKKRGFFLTAIDPRFSLEANLDRIRKTYREYEEEFSGISLPSRVNPGAYPEYLRVLDARAAGAKFEDIKDHLESRPGAGDVSIETLMQKRDRAQAAAAKLTGVKWELTAKPPA